MREEVQQQFSRSLVMRVAFALFAVVCLAAPAEARDIVATFQDLFRTNDQTPGVTLPTQYTPERAVASKACNPFLTPFGDPRYLGNLDFNTEDGGACDFDFNATVDDFFIALTFADFGTPRRKALAPGEIIYDPNAFTEGSVAAALEIGNQIAREGVQPRFRPFQASWVYDTDEDSFVMADPFLGSLLAERAVTLGKGRFAVGFAYHQIDYSRLYGQPLDSITRTVAHRDTDGNGVLEREETDILELELSVRLQKKVIELFFEYGITNNIDIGVVMPIEVIDLAFDAAATIKFVGDPNNPSYDKFDSRNRNFFCSFDNKVPVVIAPQTILNDIDRGVSPARLESQAFSCPAPTDDSLSIRGDIASAPSEGFVRSYDEFGTPQGFDFQGPVRDSKTERAVGIGDLRVRLKWHAVERKTWVPDVAFIGEVKPPTGKEDDLRGTGALSFLSYVAVQHRIWRFSPHLNAGVEWSLGPAWQDAGEWIVGTDIRVFDWLGVSVAQMGRVPFDGKVDSRYEVGVGLKIAPSRDATIFFDSIWPLVKSQGLQADRIWRVGGSLSF